MICNNLRSDEVRRSNTSVEKKSEGRDEGMKGEETKVGEAK